MKRPIGIFDSGVGGLTIAASIHRRLPAEDIVFLGDHANVPYGEKTLAELTEITERAVPTLIAEGAKVIVIACNTASVSIIPRLRTKYPDTPFVAVVPMIKPAAAQTQSGVIGVFATEFTLRSDFYAQLKADYATGITVVDLACPEWVRMIESGRIDQAVIQGKVSQALAQGADQLVLGCTHFPLLIGDLLPLVKGRAELLQSGPAIARQTERILIANEDLAEGETGRIAYLTSAEYHMPQAVGERLTTLDIDFQTVGH